MNYNFVSFQILLLSMKDMNIAKLTSVDLPLFNGIMSDLFPGIETPVIDYSKVSFKFYILSIDNTVISAHSDQLWLSRCIAGVKISTPRYIFCFCPVNKNEKKWELFIF